MVHAAVRLGQNVAALSAPPGLVTTWNPLDKNAAIGLTAGNLTATAIANAPNVCARATVFRSDLRQFEVTINAETEPFYPGVALGNSSASLNTFPGSDANGIGFNGNNTGNLNGVLIAGPGFTWGPGDVITLEYDGGAKTLRLAKNGGAFSAAFDVSVIAGAVAPMMYTAETGDSLTANFGATAFVKAPGPGVLSWNG
jgi:hypothetical protein